MRHYEIIFLVHPDQSDQTQSVLNKFSSLVTDSGGKVHRLENIGKRKLAYPIQEQFKASYALLNIECNKEALEEIKSSFKFNDSIIRDLILNKSKAHTETSILSTQTQEEDFENLSEKRDAEKLKSDSPDKQPSDSVSIVETESESQNDLQEKETKLSEKL